jgi:squalene-hopene/tetraprenyl-beta-curcumene cyclase
VNADEYQIFEQMRVNARQYLLDQRIGNGCWEGELSSSALSTATAICAIRDYLRQTGPNEELRNQVERGLSWLRDTQNQDGGWGDTTLSFSNISTTCLVWAAFAGRDHDYTETIGKCEAWLSAKAGSLQPRDLAKAIRLRYGKDQTFSVPILTALALSSRLGPGDQGWKLVPQLPFELAWFPQSWFAAMQLPVVSYALPALIAIGQVRHHNRPSLNPLLRLMRNSVIEPTRRVLKKIQPTSGGFLEATPLTSFVVMSLLGCDQHDHPVVNSGIEFLRQSFRDDGSWPIDTNLATWGTTLSVNALSAGGEPLADDDQKPIRDWLLNQQYRVVHPYTNAAPGGWAWTDLTGGVPDADDTPGALLAIQKLDDGSEAIRDAARHGVEWLLDLQNRDGGIPTFCRGWANLPFDRSSNDLTAHTLRAWRAWQSVCPQELQQRIERGRAKALHYLKKQQRANGAWVPLWFGNQYAAEEENPVYGTSRVLLALINEHRTAETESMIQRAAKFLLSCQNADGGWGGDQGCPSSIEETALTIESLAEMVIHPSWDDDPLPPLPSLKHGLSYLDQATKNGCHFPVTPIGFYFAKLWYFEKLYPVVYTVAALEIASLVFERESVVIAEPR